MQKWEDLDECSEVARTDELIITHPSTHKTERISWANITKEMGAGSVSRFDTVSDFETAMLIPKGQAGYIPDNGIVIIDELNPYIKGEEITVNNGGN